MRTALIALAIVGIGVSAAAGANVFTVNPNGTDYEASFTASIPATLNGNAVTNLMIFEEGAGGQVRVSPYDGALASGGTAVLTDTLQFLPSSALVIGTDLTEPLDGTGKRHLVMFVNQAFAASAAGKEFSQMFAPLHEQAFIDDLIAARTDATKLSLLTDYFENGPLTAAAFSAGGSFSVVESSVFPVIPEPTAIVVWSLLAGLGVGAGWRRRRAA